MASDIEHEAVLGHKSLQDFIPIKPVTETTKELTAHVVIKNSPAEGFVYVLLKQWRKDIASSPRRETWGVVQEPLEAALIYSDLRGGHISDGITPEITEDQLAKNGTERGKLSIITFEGLARALLWVLRGNAKLPENVSIVMNLGYGLVTFHMALASTSLVRLIRNLVDEGNNTLSLCTVSNTSMEFFGRGWPSRVTQAIDSEEHNMDRYEWQAAPADTREQQPEDVEPAGALALFRRSCQQKGRDKRAVLLMSLFQYSLLDVEPNTFIRVQKLSNPEAVYQVKYEHVDHLVGTSIAIDKRIVYFGPIKNVGRVIVPKYVSGFEFDNKIGQVVVSLSARRSRPEIEYAGGLRGEDGYSPQVYCEMTLPEYLGAPPVPTTSPAHTVDLSKLLLMYIYIWAGSNLPLVYMPVTLPADQYMVEQQLRRLVAKELIEIQSPTANPFIGVGRLRLYSTLKLTEIGRRTTVLLLTGKIQSIHVAHFLAQTISDDSHEAATSERAVLNIATVLETKEGLTQLARIVDTTRANQGSIKFFEKEAGLENGPAAHMKRGPLWLCLSLWSEMRVNQNYRGEEDTYRQSSTASRILDLLAGADQPGALVIHRLRSFEWDHTLENLREVLETTREADCLFPNELSRGDLLSIEKALVRAFLDKLAYIPMSHNIPDEMPFAYDLGSNRPIQSPDGPQKFQLDEEHCRSIDRLPGGRLAPGIFCIYTCMTLEEDENRQPRWLGVFLDPEKYFM
ncbi:hypothetical protein DHEL01_v212103 [Diaporthe helianthi]|uniref:Uncharacterized protein n=1 Tax=Diaporthe helianthi TaxID=158607 RepID=A0A2P5HGX8_DIAHE|nr:hypothetical protein DHEL01_v212103 [Diaporthe helianthi]